MSQSEDVREREKALNELRKNFVDKPQVWKDLLTLTKDGDSDLRYSVATALSSAFSHVADKSQAWKDLLAQTFEEINVREIITKIKKNEAVNYENVSIIGDLNLVELDLPINENGKKIVGSPIKIINSAFQGNLDLKKSIITVDFTNTIFTKDANFYRTEFKGYPEATKKESSTMDYLIEKTILVDSFRRNVGQRYVSFFGVWFFGNTDFTDAKFSDCVDFSDVLFMEKVDFQYAQFNESTRFMDAIFDKEASFSDATFIKDINFSEAKFKSVAFSGAKFSGDADFQNVDFGEKAFINNNATFFGIANFSEAKFEDDANFSWAKFLGDGEFSETKFSGNANFRATQFKEDVDFKKAIFSKYFILDDAKFTQIRVEFDSIKDRLSHDGPTYLALIKNFNGTEQFEDADNCYYQYRKWRQDKKKFGQSKIFDYLSWLSCGYGVRPSYTIFFSIVLIFIFAFFLWALSSYQTNNFSLFHYLNLSARLFIKNTADNLPYPYSYIVLIEAFSSWIISGLFVVVLTRKLIRSL
jgi:uncharacterized protein YjbI with pentapeptide repeats